MSRENMVMAQKTAATDAVRHLLQAPCRDPTSTTAPAAAEETRGSSTSETVDDEGFQTVRNKAALRRTRNLTLATLPVDPAVVATVLYQPASAGGSFRNCPRLTIAKVLWLRPGVAAIQVN
ncbi:hypothetical protein MRX96_051157 [Rhipicephalus microplus]